MKIAVIGTGNVGAVLGRALAAKGHAVTFGVRDPGAEKVLALLKDIPGADAHPVSDAAAGAEAVFLAIPWLAAQQTVRACAPFKGKILVDCMNPIAEGLKGLTMGTNTSAAEQVAAWAGDARVVKCFNTTGAKNMGDPVLSGQRATMFLCGDDSAAKGSVSQLVLDLGFDVCDAGALQAARYLEPLAMLWIHLAYFQGMGPDFAFRIIRR